MVHLEAAAEEAMIADAEKTYPHETCGLLVGNPDGGEVSVREAHRAENLNRERARDRYDLNPKDYLRIERDARTRGMEVVGFYHSHPDHPAAPSVFDRDHAHPGYAYVIWSVEKGRVVRGTFWDLPDYGHEFEPARCQSQIPGSTISFGR